MPRRCFIAAPAEAGVAPIVTALESRGWEVFDLAGVARLGSSLAEAVTDAIRSADIVVAYLEDDATRPNVSFEIGVAAGLGKPVLVLASTNVTVPAELGSFLVVRAAADNSDAMALALDNLERYMADFAARNRAGRSVERPIGPYANRLLADLPSGGVGDETELQSILIRAIEASGAVASRGTRVDMGFDIGVWSDDLDAIGGNPLLIEVKQRVDSASVRQGLLSLHQVPGARAALIVSATEHEEGEPKWLQWPVLGISLRTLLTEMRDRSFAEVVRELRNRSVHAERL